MVDGPNRLLNLKGSGGGGLAVRVLGQAEELCLEVGLAVVERELHPDNVVVGIVRLDFGKLDFALAQVLDGQDKFKGDVELAVLVAFRPVSHL